MFNVRKIALSALPMAGVIALSMPASVSAAAVGAGVVNGQVTGLAIQPVTQTAQAFNFASTTLEGVVAGNDGGNGLFAATATASGGTAIIVNGQPTAGENYAFGTGTVNTVTVSPATLTVAGVTPPGQVAVAGNLSGKYIRIGGLVVVTLNGGITLNGNGPHSATFAVVALFSPPPAQLGQTITSATFVGPFVGASAS